MPFGVLNGLSAVGVLLSDRIVRAPVAKSTATMPAKSKSSTRARLFALSSVMPSGALNELSAVGVLLSDRIVRRPVDKSTATTAPKKLSTTRARLFALSTTEALGVKKFTCCRVMVAVAAAILLLEAISVVATVSVVVPTTGTATSQLAKLSLVVTSKPLTRTTDSPDPPVSLALPRTVMLLPSVTDCGGGKLMIAVGGVVSGLSSTPPGLGLGPLPLPPPQAVNATMAKRSRPCVKCSSVVDMVRNIIATHYL